MSKQLTPEQAQQITEERWQKRTEGVASPMSCGWCDFAKKGCRRQCPIFRIAGRTCATIAEFARWSRLFDLAERREAAGDIVKLLDEHHDELIQAGHEILAEREQ